MIAPESKLDARLLLLAADDNDRKKNVSRSASSFHGLSFGTSKTALAAIFSRFS